MSSPDQPLPTAGPQEQESALFGYLIMQQSNMALMLLGKVPHPESGETHRDLDAAKLFIDQLAMLENKTKGNLSKEESTMLRQSLMGLRLAYVEAVNTPDAKPSTEAAKPVAADENKASDATASEEETRKKFTKKY
jgi:hypothetical protein